MNPVVFVLDDLPPLIEDFPESDIVPTLGLVAPVPPSVVYWDEQENCWIHATSEMRYHPVDQNYFIFNLDDDTDLRCLYYYLSDPSLILASEGLLARMKEAVFLDTT